MATEVIVTVKSSGGDYTSLNAAEAGEQRDLVAADEQATIQCFAKNDTTQVTISGFDTDATRFVKVTVPTAERHSGVWDDTKYKLSVSGTTCLTITDDYVQAEGLQVEQRFSNVSRHGVNGSRANAHHTFLSCISRKNASGEATNQVGFRHAGNILSGDGYVRYINCVAYGWEHSTDTTTVGGWATNNLTIISGVPAVIAYNCNSINNRNGFMEVVNGNVRYINCVVFGNSNTGFQNPDADFSENNASDDDTHVGDNGVSLSGIAGTDIFADYDNDDFHIKHGSVLKNAGTDLSADSGFAFTDDIDGDVRGDWGDWDIGADEDATLIVTQVDINKVFRSVARRKIFKGVNRTKIFKGQGRRKIFN